MLRAYVEAYQELVKTIQQLESRLEQLPKIAQQESLGEKVDGLAVAKQMLKHVEGLADKLKKSVKNAEALVVTLWVTDLETFSPSIQTDWVTATPDVKTSHPQINLSVHGDLYRRFCREVLSITDEELIESGAVQLHYKHWETYWSEQVRKGKALPDGVQQTLQEYKNPAVVCRMRADLLAVK